MTNRLPAHRVWKADWLHMHWSPYYTQQTGLKIRWLAGLSGKPPMGPRGHLELLGVAMGP